MFCSSWSAQGHVGVGWGFRFGFCVGSLGCGSRPNSSCSKILAKTSDRCREFSNSSITGFKLDAVGPNTLAGMVLVKEECLGLVLDGKKSSLGCLELGCKGITLGTHVFDVGKLGRGETMVQGGGGGSSGFSGCFSSKHGVVVLVVGSCAGSRLRLRAWGGRRG